MIAVRPAAAAPLSCGSPLLLIPAIPAGLSDACVSDRVCASWKAVLMENLRIVMQNFDVKACLHPSCVCACAMRIALDKVSGLCDDEPRGSI